MALQTPPMPDSGPWPFRVGQAVHAGMARIPESAIALLGRFSVAAVFWKSGQTKIEGLAIDIVAGSVELGIPRLSASAVDLFRDEYRLPLLSPELATWMATGAEHLLPLLLLLGLGTRFAALGLLGMTAVIQLLVYPSAYPTHGVWAAVLLWLMVRGPGVVSLDHLWARRRRRAAHAAQATATNFASSSSGSPSQR